MSTTPNPISSSRFPFEPHISELSPQVQYVIKNLWNVAFDAQNGVKLLKPQIDANKSSVAAVTNTVTNNSTASETIIQQIVSAYGTVNNQSGNVTYATTQADASAFIILSDTSPIAVSLTGAPVIQLPWACVLINEGVGLVTVTPASGTISYSGNLAASSLPLPQYFAAFIAFDGTNFWAVIVPIAAQTIAAVTSKWLNSYSATTGLFTSTQPAFSDISGQIAPSTQMPASGVTAGSYTNTNLTVNGEGLITAASNGSGGGGVSSLNALTGALSLTSTGSTVTITPSGSTVDLEVAARYPTVVSSALSTTGISSIHTSTFSSLAVGAYRVEFYLVVTAASGGPSMVVQLGFTDSYASESLTMFSGAVAAGTIIQTTATFYNVTASGTATLTMTPDGTVTYILQAIVLERLA